MQLKNIIFVGRSGVLDKLKNRNDRLSRQNQIFPLHSIHLDTNWDFERRSMAEIYIRARAVQVLKDKSRRANIFRAGQ